MDRKSKLLALAAKRRAETENTSEGNSAPSKKVKQSLPSKKATVSPSPSKRTNVKTISPVKIKAKSTVSVRRHSSPARKPKISTRERDLNEDEYDTNDGFLVDSDEEEVSADSEDNLSFESAEEDQAKKKSSKRETTKKVKHKREKNSKKRNTSDDSESEKDVALEEELEDLDTSLIIKTSRRTRSGRTSYRDLE
ncbi:hypothetical protein K7432_005038 [Basidiobolus ranarum]|uniref:Uncharacterized protein n=1 Tax=Basidiobolus ranarum TaxID=34480 RepID=A0ABR2W3T6_9FUNG